MDERYYGKFNEPARKLMINKRTAKLLDEGLFLSVDKNSLGKRMEAYPPSTFDDEI
jgi:hypothetical protein